MDREEQYDFSHLAEPSEIADDTLINYDITWKSACKIIMKHKVIIIYIVAIYKYSRKPPIRDRPFSPHNIDDLTTEGPNLPQSETYLLCRQI